MLSSAASKSSWRCAPPRSVITRENTRARLEPEGAPTSRPAWLCYRARVGKKRRKARGTSAGGDAEDDEAPRAPAPTGPVTTGLGALLERAGLKTLPPAKPAAPKAVQKPNAPGSRSATSAVLGPLPKVPE